MIVVPSESGFHIPTTDSIEEHHEDDIHQCGACKQQFTDIFLFMRHKSESKCSSRPGKKSTKVRVPTSLLTAGSNTSLGGASSCTSQPQTKFTRVAVLNSGALSISKDDMLKNGLPLLRDGTLPTFSSSNPPPLIITNLGSQKLGLQNQSSVGITASGGLVLEGGWNSPWSSAKVLGISNSLKQLQTLLPIVCGTEEPAIGNGITSSENCTLLSQEKAQEKEPLHTQNGSPIITIPNEDLLDDPINFFEDSQDPEQFTRSPVLLDVDDEEVAALLASHLADEQAFESNSESLSANTGFQIQLDIPHAAVDHLKYNVEETKNLQLNIGKETTIHKIAEVPVSKTMKPKKKSTPKPPRYYKCRLEGCSFKAISTRDLTRHQRKHTGEKPFKCPECDKAFTRPDKLRMHMKVHGDTNKPFQCGLCDFSSRERGGLTVHMRKHTDERPFKCQLCNHSSRTKSHLRVHLRKHTGDHPFKCDICGRAFTTGSDLTRHSKMHFGDGGEKPFSCQHCKFTCNFKSSLKAHTELNHGPDVDLLCPICQHVCATRMDFRNHCKVHQDDPKYCNLCDAICSSNVTLNKHLKQHLVGKVKEAPLLTTKKTNPRASSFSSDQRGAQRRIRKAPMKLKGVILDTPDVYNCRYCTESFFVEDALEEHVRQHQLEELAADPVLAFSIGSQEMLENSNSMDVMCGLSELSDISPLHNPEQQLLFKLVADSQTVGLRSTEILASFNQSSDQNNLCDDLNGIQYMLPNPLGTLDDNDSSLLC